MFSKVRVLGHSFAASTFGYIPNWVSTDGWGGRCTHLVTLECDSAFVGSKAPDADLQKHNPTKISRQKNTKCVEILRNSKVKERWFPWS